MSPYRSTPARGRTNVLRLGEPTPAAVWLGALLWLVLWALVARDLAFVPCLLASVGTAATAISFACRRRAWIVMMPLEERVRVVRLFAWSYSASTLRLSDAMRVECSPIGNTMWIFIAAKDGRTARVIPARSTRMLGRVQATLEDALRSADIRPGIPSPR